MKVSRTSLPNYLHLGATLYQQEQTFQLIAKNATVILPFYPLHHCAHLCQTFRIASTKPTRSYSRVE